VKRRKIGTVCPLRIIDAIILSSACFADWYIMSITIPISAEVKAGLELRAAAAGQDVETYAGKVLERIAHPRSLEELSGPVHRRFLKSGTTEEQLGEELEKAKHEMRAQRRARHSA